MKIEKVQAYRVDGILYEERPKAIAVVRRAIIEAVIRDIPEEDDPQPELLDLIADKWDIIEREVEKAIGSI